MGSKIYNGKKKKDLIKQAVAELGIAEENLTITVIEEEKKGFLRKGEKASIRVEYNDADLNQESSNDVSKEGSKDGSKGSTPNAEELEEFDKNAIEFLIGLFTRMELDVDLEVDNNGKDKVNIDLKSDDSALIIGKRGKCLEAIQILTNIAAGKDMSSRYKAVIDIENYREKRENTLTELATRMGRDVVKKGKPSSLEPMNPFERRLIHIALKDFDGVETRSEGEGIKPV